MVKTRVVETVEKFDKDGNLIERTTREENTEDDTDYLDRHGYMVSDDLSSYVSVTSDTNTNEF